MQTIKFQSSKVGVAHSGKTQRNTVCIAHKDGRNFSVALTATVVSAALNTGLLAPNMAQAYDKELGAAVFNGNCAACHMGGRNSVIQEKTLDKAALEKYLAGGFKLEAIIYQVENGKGAMPAWDGRLDEDEITAVSNYVYEQALNDAWPK